MLTKYYDQLTETHKGILLMVIGFLMLAYQQGWFFLEGLREMINLSFMLLSFACIGYGFYKLEGHKKILALLEKKRK
jgi:hypothetical protein